MMAMELVEVFQWSTKEKIFANIATGECFWDPPPGYSIKRLNTSQWWELFDSNSSRFYYFNPADGQTVWKRPCNAEVIPLAQVQCLGVHSTDGLFRLETKEIATQTTLSKSDVTETRLAIEANGGTEDNTAAVLQHSSSLDSAKTNIVKVRLNLSDDVALNEPELPADSSRSLNLATSVLVDAADDKQSTTVLLSNTQMTSFDSDIRSKPLKSPVMDSTPRQRRAFPRTNPTFFGSVNPDSGDRRFARRSRPDNSTVSVSNSSLNESLDRPNVSDETNFTANQLFTVQQYFAYVERDDSQLSSKSERSSERAIDCPVYDKNGNEITTTVKSASLQELREFHTTGDISNYGFNSGAARVSMEVSLSPDNRSSFIQRHASLSGDSSVADASSSNSNLSEQNVVQYRQKATRQEQRRVHRRQSSESDASYLRSPVDYRMSVPTYGSGNHLSVMIDPSITDFLNEHHTGIRRKTVSVVNMLSWTKDGIRKPMFRVTDRSVKKEAVEVFKLIQTYMGDRPCKSAPVKIAQEIVSKGWSNSQLRDELYMQLLRQVTENPGEASLIRGWELLSVCLSMFPPSARFLSYVDGFITRYADPSVTLDKPSVRRFAVHCQRRLISISKLGARRGQRPPSVDEVEQALKSVFRPGMFGSSLTEIMLLQAQQYPKRRLPWLQTALSEAVLRLNGSQTEGIFRVSGDIDEVYELKTSCEKWVLPSTCTEPHTPASLLKLWYRELGEPLIPDNFYDECIEYCQDAEHCVRLVNRLPPLNRLVFSYLIRFLQVFAKPENVAVTKMDANNIAMVWAPNCLRCQSDHPVVIFENARKEMAFLRNVIENLDTGFMQGVI